METEFTNNDTYKYQKAKEKVEAIKGFYGNLLAYCIVIPILAYINYSTTNFPWVIFPALGWGFGVIMNGLYAYGYNPLFSKNWEERKIKQYMQEL
ncbi:2TM domain-containing protein [Maribacter sp. M208]|uniref:2TM domain-containing protein n=1 Tax=Maribacter TaxID=252356 RepID=UPI0023EC25A6|nr:MULTISPECIES: 2TM domain-containing protein [Maribacter]MDF4221893.1 2TM domain-containing protein [Maribacter huludaoensis]